MLSAYELERTLRTRLSVDTKHEYRDYLGMSGIGGCPRQLYNGLVHPTPPDPRLLWYSWTGYMHEAAVIQLLGVKQVTREIVAKFDNRFRGHTDHESEDGRVVIDVKSIGWTKLLQVRANGATFKNRAQVQMYIRHGGFEHGILLYVARDVPHKAFYILDDEEHGFWVPPFVCVDVEPDRAFQDKLDEKARMILTAVDDGLPPVCTCRYCKS